MRKRIGSSKKEEEEVKTKRRDIPIIIAPANDKN